MTGCDMLDYGTVARKNGKRLPCESLAVENAKLRELAHLLLWGIDNDMPRDEELVWSQKVDALVSELGIEVDE